MAERASGRTRGALWAGLVLAGIAALVVAFSAGYIGSAGAESGSADARWLSIPAPEAEFRTLEGKKASLADYRGQVVILNLWGTWCPPCRREIPELVELQAQLEERGATVVSIAVDSGAEESIRSFASEFGIDYPIW
ncbi:MAG: TlpA disulfide reductase family protein, partial [Gemmatimonadota bacterium]